MKLGVNIDHIATLRQARRINIPDPLTAAKICEQSGCHSIVCHLREDRRHINENDLRNLRRIVTTKLNLEMSCVEEIVDIALEIKPDQVTLVPERREELTTEGGLDVVLHKKTVGQTVKRLSKEGISVSLFIDPEKTQIEAAQQVGVECIELHTGKYAQLYPGEGSEDALENLVHSVEVAHRLGLHVFAGHGLDYENVKQIAKIKQIEELNIGFAIIAKAVFIGLKDAVKQMLNLTKRSGDKKW